MPESEKNQNQINEIISTRKDIVIRLLYTFLFLIVLGVIFNIIWIIAAFQYLFLLVTKKHIKPLRSFSSNFTLYLKEVMDFVLVVTNKKPFPFNEFPKESLVLESLDVSDIDD
ncbi:MAG: glucose-1-phosphate thymidylyltransferase [Deltaproteobacteria bacterium]|nr:MAG: glucose-1-phosphate thymidylyltransferase [Deltaproteobacteria bacterium]